MTIFVNGTAHEVPEDITIQNLLIHLSCADCRVAVELNHDIVPRSSYLTQKLAHGDRVEVVQAIGGG